MINQLVGVLLLHFYLKILVDKTGIFPGTYILIGVSRKQNRMRAPRLSFMGLWALFSCSLDTSCFARGVVGRWGLSHFEIISFTRVPGFLMFSFVDSPVHPQLFLLGYQRIPWRLLRFIPRWKMMKVESPKTPLPKGALPQGHTWSNTFSKALSWYLRSKRCKTTYWHSSKSATAFPCPLPSETRVWVPTQARSP